MSRGQEASSAFCKLRFARPSYGQKNRKFAAGKWLPRVCPGCDAHNKVVEMQPGGNVCWDPEVKCRQKKCHQRAKFDFYRGIESRQSGLARAYLHSGTTVVVCLSWTLRGARKTSETHKLLFGERNFIRYVRDTVGYRTNGSSASNTNAAINSANVVMMLQMTILDL